MPGSRFELHPLTPERLPEFLDFFEHRAFTDNSRWQSCYCYFPHADHAVVRWETRTAAENRAASCERIVQGHMNGWLAYADGLSIGWCNAGPRNDVAGLFDEPEPLADRIGAITCFVVEQRYRGQGIATDLLQAACNGLAARGLEWAEAYPRSRHGNDAENHHGTLAMYLKAGFEVVRQSPDGTYTVRKALKV